MKTADFQIDQLAIYGVGLIGGSLAAAARARGIARTVIGYGRNPARLEAARAAGIIDEVATDLSQLSGAAVVVVCTPVDLLAGDIIDVLEKTPDTTLVTDVGSVKRPIVNQVSEKTAAAARYIGAHPLAGSHLKGFENSDPQLYEDRLCIMTPGPHHNPESTEMVRQFWQAIGMRVSETTPEEHDRILALTSHLPHLAASAVAAVVDDKLLDFASTGYRDTTRVAAGDPDLWTAIFSQNSNQVAIATDQLIDVLQKFRNAIVLGRQPDVTAFLKIAQDRRAQFRDGNQHHDEE